MTRILIIKSIFCPNEEYFKTSFNGILNLRDFIEYSDKKNITLDFMIIGWCKKKIFKAKIIKILKLLGFSNPIIKIWQINFGKFKIFNEILQVLKIYKKYDYIFYSDHDIIFTLEDKNILHDLKNICLTKIDNKNICFIALNQKEDIRHQMDIYENKKIINNLEIVYPHKESLGSIADGCFFADANKFSLLDEFICCTTYGLDDYFLMKKLDENNYLSVVASDLYVIHPFNQDEEYNNWKKNEITDLIVNGIDPKNYFKSIEQSNNFWEFNTN